MVMGDFETGVLIAILTVVFPILAYCYNKGNNGNGN